MKVFLTCILLSGLGGAAAQTPPAPAPAAPALATLDRYVERYCDDTTSHGIGVLASETLDFKFRQRLKASTDIELKRLFVLKSLYQEIETSLIALERGTAPRPGRPRRFDPTEAIAALRQRLQDLATLDPRDSQRIHQSFRDRLRDMEERLARDQ